MLPRFQFPTPENKYFEYDSLSAVLRNFRLVLVFYCSRPLPHLLWVSIDVSDEPHYQGIDGQTKWMIAAHLPDIASIQT